MSTIKIRQWPALLTSRKNTILEAALKEGIPYPHGCRSGQCGSCKTQLFKGEVNHAPYFEEALSNSERDEGFILACRAKPQSDLEIAWVGEIDPAACFPVRRLETVVHSLDRPAPDVTSLQLEVKGKPLTFAPGQYARIRFGKLPARSYSMANHPDDRILEFHIRHVPDGVVSIYAAQELAVGDSVNIEGPFGSSYLRENHPGPIVAIGGGTGLAPALSIVRTALTRMSKRPIHLYFGVQDELNVYAEDELRQLEKVNTNLNVHIVLSEPSSSTARRVGFVHQALEQDLASANGGNLIGSKVYAAGPPPMVEAVKSLAQQYGLTPDDVHIDSFVSSGEDDTGFIEGLRRSFTGLFKKRTALPVQV